MTYYTYMYLLAATTPNETTFLEKITGQPFIVSFLLVVALLFAFYTLLETFKFTLLQRLLALIPVMLLLAVAYFQHGPLIATLLLSVGFLLSFVLSFAQLTGKK